MEERTAEELQETSRSIDPRVDEPEDPTEAGALKAENEGFWQAIERYAPQIVGILAEHGDTELLASVAQRLSSSKNNRGLSHRADQAADDPIQRFATETAKQFVDFLFASQHEPSAEAGREHPVNEHEEAGRIEEHTRREALRRSTVERGSAERREPGITLDAKSKEIAQAFGIPEDKLAQAALERLRRKGVVRP